MFTGIIEEMGTVVSAPAGRLVISAGKVHQGMELGGSVDVNGACLTVTRFDAGTFSVDIMSETLRRTNLGFLHAGDRVNLERPLTLGKPLGGHLVQGHVDATGKVASVIQENETTVIGIEAPAELMPYIVSKGFIAVDGISLTVAARDASSFKVSIVDYTLKNTNLGGRQAGELVNLEVDIIAKYVEQLVDKPGQGITFDFLKEHGFVAG
jgi:riboflavin synthase